MSHGRIGARPWQPYDLPIDREGPLVNSTSRRRFVCALGAVALSTGPRTATAVAGTERALSFDNLHTGERLNVEYYASGVYVPQALAAVNLLLRDFRTGEVGPIDAALLDLLHRLATATGSRRPFQIISGYRSPATNEALRRRSSGVASASLHTVGQAIDIRLDDVPLETLRDAAVALRSGGVGHYPASNFVHVDTGRLRTW
jgi:uncharacterized protein YcbK (DUF882 family)